MVNSIKMRVEIPRLESSRNRKIRKKALSAPVLFSNEFDLINNVLYILLPTASIPDSFTYRC
jgi:hypothetical protein